MTIKTDTIYYGAHGNSGRRAYLVESFLGTVETTQQVLRDGQFHDVTIKRVAVTGRRYYPSTGKTDKTSQTYYLSVDAQQIGA